MGGLVVAMTADPRRHPPLGAEGPRRPDAKWGCCPILIPQRRICGGARGFYFCSGVWGYGYRLLTLCAAPVVASLRCPSVFYRGPISGLTCHCRVTVRCSHRVFFVKPGTETCRASPQWSTWSRAILLIFPAGIVRLESIW